MNKGVVLVVDDEASIRDILSFYLKRAGYQVLLAEDGRKALDSMAKLQPDLILSDLRMPEMAGDEFCRAVKGNAATRDIYFILVSAMDGTVNKVGGLALGADDMITKPFHAQEVMAKVESAFRMVEMQKEIKRQNQELTRAQEKVKSELELAAKFQMGLLPEIPGKAGVIAFTHRYLPAEGIGGDIYSIIPTPGGGAAILIADVSGHGVTAALISAMVKTSFEGQVRLGGSPVDWAREMNRHLAESTLAEQFATAFIGLVEPGRAEVRYVLAGHTPPFRLARGAGGGLHRPEILGGKGFMLGIDRGLPFEERISPYEVGDRLILYTDGLVEVEREDRRFLGEDGLMRFCAELPADGDLAADQLVGQTRAYNHPVPFTDDVTLVVIDSVA